MQKFLNEWSDQTFLFLKLYDESICRIQNILKLNETKFDTYHNFKKP